MTARLVLHYDIVSPWSYVAFVNLSRYVKLWEIEMELKPINLGYVMKHSNNKPPITVVNKGRWMGQEMNRAEYFYGVKLQMPDQFPFNSFPLQCALRVLQQTHPNHLHSATSHFFFQVWSSSSSSSSSQVVDVTTSEGITREFKRWGGLNDEEIHALMRRAAEKETRSLLNEEARQLVEQGGAFGAPWIITTRPDGRTAKWFGSDRTEQIAAFLEKPYRGPMADGSVSASKL